MRIDAYYDILCPFSFLAKRYLELARQRYPTVPTALELKPFMLMPSLPRGPHDFRAAFVQKYGEGARVPMWDRVIGLGQEVGIDFAFYRIQHGAHAIMGHRAVHFAKRHGKGAAMLEALYQAFYERAEYIGEARTVAARGADIGLPADALQHYLEGDADEAEIFALTEQYKRDPGVTGMPFHVIDGEVFTPPAGLQPWLDLFERKASAAA